MRQTHKNDRIVNEKKENEKNLGNFASICVAARAEMCEPNMCFALNSCND